jgi:hypothetical protein
MGQGDLLEQILKLKEQLRDLYFQYFMERELFSWVWWLLIALIIVPLAVWWKLVDKKRLIEICMFGLLINIAATFLDVLGSELLLWEYPVHVLPRVPLLIPVDYVVLPVIQMYIYQRFTKWKKYIIVSVIAAAMQSFVAEPLAIWIGQYKLVLWQLIYSFPIYLIIDFSAKFLIELFKKRQAKANGS